MLLINLVCRKCPYGWKGADCKEMDSPILAAVIGGSICFGLLVIVIGVVCCQRRYNTSE